MISVSGGLKLTSLVGYGFGGPVDTTNNGFIEINSGSAANFQGTYGGSGVRSVRGAAGVNATATSLDIAGAASGTFDVASGKLEFDTTPVTFNFLALPISLHL